jgi:heat shock protein HslJ
VAGVAKRALQVAAMATLWSLVTGCAAAPGNAPVLPGSHWKLVDASRGALQAHGAASGVTLAFGSARVSGYSGCNSYSGDYTLAGGTLGIGSVTRTKRGCADAPGAVEAAWFEALERKSLQVVQQPERLTLTTADGLRLDFAPGQAGDSEP